MQKVIYVKERNNGCRMREELESVIKEAMIHKGLHSQGENKPHVSNFLPLTGLKCCPLWILGYVSI
jgi:hypothetical protein